MESLIKKETIEGGAVMGKEIKWETEFKHALSKAQAEGTHVLVDFFNPG